MKKPAAAEAALSRQKRRGGITSRDALRHQIWNRPDESKGRVRCGALTRRVAVDSLVDAAQGCSAAVADEQWTRGVAPTKVDGAAGQADEPNGAHWNFMMSGTVGRASGARRKHG